AGEQRDPNVVLYLLSCFLQTPCDDTHCEMDGEPGASSGARICDDGGKVIGPAIRASTVNGLVPLPPVFYSDQANKSIYRYSRMESKYTLNPLRVQIPIAGDVSQTSQDSSTVVRLGRPQARRIIKYDAERVGSAPPIPEPLDTYQDGAIKGALLYHSFTPLPPTTSPGGTQLVYRAMGEYVYALNRAPLPSEKVLVGVLPFTNLGQDDNRFDPSVAYDGTIGPGTAPAPLTQY
ncbi:MAG TPA: hypothetical protein VG125_10505, partial [Pirellulales bacterium]|nr:hypothetical protein [Pirellulales bacterium]